MFVCCECCVLSGRGLCDGLITRPEESYRLWRVVVCDQETSLTRRLKPATGLWKIQPQWFVTAGKQTNKQCICIRSAARNESYVSYLCKKYKFSPIEGSAQVFLHCIIKQPSSHLFILFNSWSFSSSSNHFCQKEERALPATLHSNSHISLLWDM